MADTLQNKTTITVGTSIQIAEGPRLCGNGDPGGSKKLGDIWTANGYVYIRSNASDVKIT